jgi:hypothetical protein
MFCCVVSVTPAVLNTVWKSSSSKIPLIAKSHVYFQSVYSTVNSVFQIGSGLTVTGLESAYRIIIIIIIMQNPIAKFHFEFCHKSNHRRLQTWAWNWRLVEYYGNPEFHVTVNFHNSCILIYSEFPFVNSNSGARVRRSFHEIRPTHT